MSYSEVTPAGKDPELWERAKRRASFRSHISIYLVIVPFFWVIWWLSGAHTNGRMDFPWPIWPTLGWGIGVFFHYMGAYVWDKNNAVEREYQKLKRDSH